LYFYFAEQKFYGKMCLPDRSWFAPHGRAKENKESLREEVPIAMGASSFFFVQVNGGFVIILD
jgi:hypothetical protein